MQVPVSALIIAQAFQESALDLHPDRLMLKPNKKDLEENNEHYWVPFSAARGSLIQVRLRSLESPVSKESYLLFPIDRFKD